MKYITKTVTATEISALVFNLESNSLETRKYTFNGNPTDKVIEKAFQADNVKFLKVDSRNTVEELRRISEQDFTRYARKLTADDSRQNMVTRTISDYKTTVLVYDLESDKLEERLFTGKVDVKKMNLVNAVPIKVLTETKTDILYGISLDTFISLSEVFER